jgi:hypothetical protein
VAELAWRAVRRMGPPSSPCASCIMPPCLMPSDGWQGYDALEPVVHRINYFWPDRPRLSGLRFPRHAAQDSCPLPPPRSRLNNTCIKLCKWDHNDPGGGTITHGFDATPRVVFAYIAIHQLEASGRREGVVGLASTCFLVLVRKQACQLFRL